MRESINMEIAEQWAEYVRTHPEWKKLHTTFINAHLEKASAEIEILSKTPAGREKLAELRGIRDIKRYLEIFGKV